MPLWSQILPSFKAVGHGLIVMGCMIFPGETTLFHVITPEKELKTDQSFDSCQWPTWWISSFLLGILTGVWGRVYLQEAEANGMQLHQGKATPSWVMTPENLSPGALCKTCKQLPSQNLVFLQLSWSESSPSANVYFLLYCWDQTLKSHPNFCPCGTRSHLLNIAPTLNNTSGLQANH